MNNVRNYLAKKYTLLDTPGVYKNGKMFVMYEGKEILESEFKITHRLPIRVFAKKENPNKRIMFLNA